MSPDLELIENLTALNRIAGSLNQAVDVRGVLDRLDFLGDRHFLSARQENLETIHHHNVQAERFGLIGEIRREIASGEPSTHHSSMREWLDGIA